MNDAIRSVALGVAIFAAADHVHAQYVRDEPAAARLPKVAGNAAQFDSWLGEWDARTLTRDGSTGEWREAGMLHMQIVKAMAGQVVLEFARGQIMAGGGKTLGFSARAYDPEAEEWNLLLLWPSPDDARWSPMAGSFRHGRGEFFVSWPRQEDVDGVLRYSFSDIHDDRLRWDSARSLDGGENWATSMIFEFARREPDAEPLHADRNEDNSYGTSEASRKLDFLIGSWQGERALQASGDTAQISRETTLHLEGALMITNETRIGQDDKVIAAMEFAAYDAARTRWVRFTIDEQTPRLQRWFGTLEGNGVTWTSGTVRESAQWGAPDAAGPSLSLARTTKAETGAWREEWSVRLR